MSGRPNNKADLLSLIGKNEDKVRSYGVHKLALFGSFARDESTAESDVDFLVEFAPGAKSFDSLMGLAFFLEDLIGRKVELVTLESLSPHIGPHILEEAEDAVFAP